MGDTTLYLLCLVFSAVESTIVYTNTGPVNGLIHSEGYESFEGIPYAQSPTGKLRFQPPEPIETWTEVIQATSPGPVCPQPNKMYNTSSEDCLYLNIYTPSASPDEPMPVMIYIHGGDFLRGAGNKEPVLGPEKIMENNIILVTMNYRLGALGYLSMGNETLPGNYGVKDILVALKWIYENIELFGGDPDRITLSGQESGAMMVNHMLCTDESSGYYQRAMLFSGHATSFRALQRNPLTVFKEFVSKLNLTYTDNDDLIEKLRNVNVTEIMRVQNSMIDDAPDMLYVKNNKFMPCIEPESSSALITSDPVAVMKAGSMLNMPILTGYNNAEGLEVFPNINNEEMETYPNRVNYLNENFDACVPRDLTYANSLNMLYMTNSIREEYMDSGNISIFNTQNFVNMMTEALYATPCERFIDLVTVHNETAYPIYYYVLNIDSIANWFKANEGITFTGAAHDDNLGFLFVPTLTKSILDNLSATTQASINAFRTYIYNFISHGNPSPESTNNTSVQWLAAGTDRRHIELGDTIDFYPQGYETDRLDFWRDMYFQNSRLLAASDDE